MDKQQRYTVVEMDVNDLHVSKTNPRFIQTVLNEDIAISELINLEIKKMVKLTKSVIETGMLPITFYCFKENGEIVLADGNRRLTVIKILQDYSLIPDNSKTKELVELCRNAGPVELPSKIPCVIYDEWSDELFNILNSLHVTDDSKSDWTPLAQYRMSSRHGGNKHSWMKTLLFYYDDKEVDLMTNRKADVFRRMFDALKSIKITVSAKGEIETTNAKNKLDAFYKLIKTNIVDTRTNPDEFKEKVKEIFKDEILPIQEKYNFSLRSASIYESQEFSLSLLGLTICTENGKAIKYDENTVSYTFINPLGEHVKEFKSSVGTWEICVEYDGEKKNLQFNVKEKEETQICLTANRVSVKVGNSVFLRSYILSATNAFNEEVKSKVKIKAAPKQSVQIENDTLSGDVVENTYKILYQYKDKNGECSKTLYVQVTDEEDFSPLKGVITKNNLLSWGSVPILIDYDNTVSELINEINQLDFVNFPNIISCSCRAILELSYDNLFARGEIASNLKRIEFIDRLKLIVGVLTDNLKYIVDGDPKTFNSFHDEQNFLNTFDEAKFKSINGRLNSAAHKSGKNVNLNELEECIRKDISRLVALINQLLK